MISKEINNYARKAALILVFSNIVRPFTSIYIPSVISLIGDIKQVSKSSATPPKP